MKKKTVVGLVAGSVVALSSIFAGSTYSLAFADQKKTDDTIVSKEKKSVETTTPIKHVVVIFSENVSFDHYFGTYPNAKNPAGEPKFQAKANTPSVNGLTNELLNHNPNQFNPKRLDRSQAMTDDMDHEYTDEQKAFNGGKMDKFVEYTSGGSDKSLVMDYYDGNTVTGLWNYAQNFAMSDNSFGTTFGPSTPGALNLISGQTHGAVGYENGQKLGDIEDNVVNGTIIGDPDPYFDKASNPKRAQAELAGKNIGDLLNKKELTWGWFQGGFRDTTAQHNNIAGKSVTDYNPHHEPFQYYKSTSNPDHLPPSSVAMIGRTDQANHQYDLADFWKAADTGNLPAVSYLKAANYQDGHAGYSDPLDEQHFIVDTINRIQSLPEWKDTAVIVAYDDSDGWYDHVMPQIVNGSNDAKTDALYGPGNAGKPKLGEYLNRAGYGPRLPLLVISPYAKKNFVDHTLTDQTSILRFIEDNWNLGRIGDDSFDAIAGTLNNMFDFKHEPNKEKLFLDPITGEPINVKGASGWVYDQDVWYYYDNNGVKKTGWVSTGNKWYYLNDSGVMQTGWVSVGGKWYYLNNNGAMETDWVSVGGKWYYLNNSGAMETGWVSVGGKWYYLNNSGAMETDWVSVGGKWYYLYNDGSMAVNTVINGYKLGYDGALM